MVKIILQNDVFTFFVRVIFLVVILVNVKVFLTKNKLQFIWAQWTNSCESLRAFVGYLGCINIRMSHLLLTFFTKFLLSFNLTHVV